MAKRLCEVPGCDHPHSQHGMCQGHRARFIRHGDVMANAPFRKRLPNTVCLADGCDRTPKNLGYCPGHYARVRHYGDPQAHISLRPIRGADAICEVDGCGRQHVGKGYCSQHLKRFNETGDPQADLPLRKRYDSTCSVDGCERPHKTIGYCGLHWERVAKHGDPLGHIPPKVVEVRTECTVAECGRPHRSHGFCAGHLSRYYAHGDPQADRPILDQRRPCPRPGCGGPLSCPDHRMHFWTDVSVAEDGCWLWIGTLSPNGRGQALGTSDSAYRVAYQLLVGSIPADLHLDHLCCVPACVNPAHLEPVTPAENMRRRDLAKRGEWSPILPPAPLCPLPQGASA